MKVSISKEADDSLDVLQLLKDFLVQNKIVFEVIEVGSDLFKCDVCGKGFSTHNAVECHKAMKHPPTVRCKFCNIDVKNKAEYEIHCRGRKHLAAVNKLKFKDIKVYQEETKSTPKIDDNIGNRK